MTFVHITVIFSRPCPRNKHCSSKVMKAVLWYVKLIVKPSATAQDIRLAIADQILAENSGYLNCWNRIGIGRIRATCDKSLTWASVRIFCRNRITEIWRYLRSEAAICNKIAAVCVIYWPFDIREFSRDCCRPRRLSAELNFPTVPGTA